MHSKRCAVQNQGITLKRFIHKCRRNSKYNDLCHGRFHTHTLLVRDTVEHTHHSHTNILQTLAPSRINCQGMYKRTHKGPQLWQI